MANININLNPPELEKVIQDVFQRFQHLDAVGVLLVILSLIFPPLVAFIKVGFSTHFWINLLLTVLGYIPGQIHAIWMVLFL